MNNENKISSPSLQSSLLQSSSSSSNVVWEPGVLTLEDRELLNGGHHKAAVVWFTGLSGSGKSTVAKLVEHELHNHYKVHTMFLDGDNLRHGLNQDLSFSDRDREENIRRVAHVAALGFHHGNIVLGSFISPYSRDRQMARSLVPEGRFLEIFVKCDVDVLKQRDPKGLYAKAVRGEIPNFTGISAPYEVPENPELVIETDSGQTPLALANMVLKTLADRGIIQMYPEQVEACDHN